MSFVYLFVRDTVSILLALLTGRFSGISDRVHCSIDSSNKTPMVKDELEIADDVHWEKKNHIALLQ